MALVVFKTIITNQKIVDTYVSYIKDPNNTTVGQGPIVNRLEQQIAPMFGAVSRGGNAKLIPDFEIRDQSILKVLNKQVGPGITDVEAKLKQGNYGEGATSFQDVLAKKSRTEVSVGSSVLPENVLTNLDEAHIKKLNANNGYLLFNTLKQQTPALFEQFYNKAKLLQISYKIGTSIQALNAYTPRSNFKIPPFKMRYYSTDNTIYLSLNDSFEKKLLALLSDVKPIAADSAEQFAKGLEDAKRQTQYIKQRGKKRVTGIDVLVPSGGSIPLTAAKVKAKQASKKQPSNRPTLHQFIKSAEWTRLVQARLGKTMSHFGGANPPDLTWRTGRNFVGTVNLTVNYRTNTIQYSYNPFLDSLKAYGYQPGLQVERSIREVAQQEYARAFNIIRRPGF